MEGSSPPAMEGEPFQQRRTRASGFLRLGLAASGPASTAAVHFIQSMLLLHYLPPESFGSFAFLLVIAGFSWAAWNAVFCTPLAFLVSGTSEEQRAERVNIVGSAVLLAALLAPIAYFPVAIAVGLGTTAALLFSGFATITLIRWFGRANAYLHNRPLRSFTSDLTYSLVLLGALGYLWLTGSLSLSNSYAAMTAAALLALLPFGPALARALLSRLWAKPLRSYWRLARTQAPWSLAGVVANELKANAHVYIVTAWGGTQAYAPIAATALLVRPMTVASGALRDIERPRFARLVSGGRFGELFANIAMLRLALFLVWAVIAAAVVVLFMTDPNFLFPSSYDLRVLQIGALLWLLVSGLAMLRVPETALLQAVGTFRASAFASYYAALVSVAAVVLLVSFAGPVWSIAGIFVGQAVHAVQIAAIVRAWRRDQAVAQARLEKPEIS